MRFLVIATAGLALASCQTTDELMAKRQAHLNAGFVGKPLSAYMLANGHNPENSFDMPDGTRVFVFGDPCRANWHTRPQNGGGSPANFIVTKIDVHFCSLQTN